MFTQGFTKIAISTKAVEAAHESFLAKKVNPAYLKLNDKKLGKAEASIAVYSGRANNFMNQARALEESGAPYRQRRMKMQHAVSSFRNSYKNAVPIKPSVKQKYNAGLGKKVLWGTGFGAALLGGGYIAHKMQENNIKSPTAVEPVAQVENNSDGYAFKNDPSYGLLQPA